jgi:NAD(P)-dependent dehydrogenase (short-subunit alcohol dehydrogenase family)
VQLAGARCLVTGCSSGIGRATALALASAGAEVVASARGLEAIADLAERGLHTLALDVTDPVAVARGVQAAQPLDVLVNNAGYGLEGAVEEVSDDELLAQYDVNVFGVWRLCRAVLPGMRERGKGAIVNISSFGGQAPFPGIGAYRSSKFALEGLTWTLRLEVAHFGINVVSVQPGLTDTDFGTRSLKRARAMKEDGPYGAMRESARRAYPRMSPSALDPESVAESIVAKLNEDWPPLHVRVGEDAERVLASVQQGDDEYERYLVEQLGFDWHPWNARRN